MLPSAFTCVFPLLITALALENPISNFPKCCNGSDVLKLNEENSRLNDTLYLCVNNTYQTTHLVTSGHYFPSNCSGGDFCVDEVETKSLDKTIVKINCPTPRAVEKINLKPSFYKCCPLGRIYDLSEHKCVESDSSLKVNETYIWFGLPKCLDVIVDYEVRKLELVYSDPDGAIRIPGKKEVHKFGSYCMDRSTADYVVRVCEKDTSRCRKPVRDGGMKCIAKCCEDGHSYVGGATCLPTYSYGINLKHKKVRSTTDQFAVIQPLHCKKYMEKDRHKFTLDEDGLLHLEVKNETTIYHADDKMYCMEHVDMKDKHGDYFFFCLTKEDNTKFLIKGSLMIVSCVFLLVTIAGYIILPELQNLYGRTLICYCSSLMTAFIFLIIAIFYSDLSGTPCVVIGFAIMFTFLAAFTWLNIMCFDIWLTLRSLKAAGVNQRQRDQKKFLWYNLYSWLVPLILTVITIIIHDTDAVPDEFMPKIGKTQCFFETKVSGSYGHLIFFVTPIALLKICDCFFFVSTTYYCFKVKNEISKMKDDFKKNKFNADKERLGILFKLFLVMGILWVFEVLTSVIDFQMNKALQVFESIFDVFNSLQGVFIFWIFMLKKKVFFGLAKKLGWNFPRRTSQTETSALTSSSTLLNKTSGLALRKISTNPEVK